MNLPTVPFPIEQSTDAQPLVIGVPNTGEAVNVLVIAIQMGLTCAYQPIPGGPSEIKHMVLVDCPQNKLIEFKRKLEMIS